MVNQGGVGLQCDGARGDIQTAGQRCKRCLPRLIEMLDRLSTSARDLRARLNSVGPRATGRRSPRGERRPVTGLDIEPGHAIAAQVSVNGRLGVERAAGVSLAPGVVRDGEVVDADALSGALRELFAEHGLERRVRVGVANQRVMVRPLDLPPIADPSELEAAVRFKAQDEIPMPLDSVVLDFHDAGVIDTPAGPRQQVVLAAARRDMVERLLGAVEAAGLVPEGIDVAAFALMRAVGSAATDHEHVVYLSFAGMSNLVVAQGRVCVFNRALSTGLETMAATVAERAGIPVLNARSLVHGAGVGPAGGAEQAGAPAAVPSPIAITDGSTDIPGAVASEPEAGSAQAAHGPDAVNPKPGPAPDQELVRAAVADGLRQIAADTRNSLDYIAGLHEGARVGRVVLCGPGADLPGARAYLEQAIGLPVQERSVSEARPGAGGGLPLSCLGVAAGLAVAEGPA